MKTYAFDVILAAGTDITEELADAFFDAGCDDGTPGQRCGVPVITFSREAESCSNPPSAVPWPTSRKPVASSSECRSKAIRS